MSRISAVLRQLGRAAQRSDSKACAGAVLRVLGRPVETVPPGTLGAEFERVDRQARAVEHLDLDAVGRRSELEAAFADAVADRHLVARHGHVAAHQGGALQRLHLHELARQRLDRTVQLLDAADRVDLRHLARDLGVVHRVERVLVLHLRDEQFEKPVRRGLDFLRRLGGRVERLAVGAERVDRGSCHGVRVPSVHWPSCKVLSSSVLAVFMTSMLFWYEREAEIMFTISSTAFTLL